MVVVVGNSLVIRNENTQFRVIAADLVVVELY